MLKNVTLSAEESLIEKVRKKATLHNTTMNELFRQWMAHYAREAGASEELEAFLNRTDAAAGRSFSRDEMNER